MTRPGTPREAAVTPCAGASRISAAGSTTGPVEDEAGPALPRTGARGRGPGREGADRVHVQAVRGWGDRARLGVFVGKLAVKEHLAPRLHVRPLVAELFLTDNCNLRCVSCACWRTVTRDELSTQEWLDVVDQLAALGILKANFTGGEPLLRRDAPAIMHHARRRGIRNLHLNTNATLLDDARRTEVLDAGVRSLNVSVDGPDGEVHDLIRGVSGSFDRTTWLLRGSPIACSDQSGMAWHSLTNSRRIRKWPRPITARRNRGNRDGRPRFTCGRSCCAWNFSPRLS